jgi:hypothetical protein
VDAITAKGIIPTGAEVQAQLQAEGLPTALATVLNDMVAVGCPSRQAHKSKPEPVAMANEQGQLPGF